MIHPTRRDLLAGSAAVLLAQRLQALPLSNIKLGITTDEIDDDVLIAARFLKEHGLKWAEVRNIWGPYNTSQPMEKIREACKIFDENGIKVSIEGTGFFKIPLPPETPEGQAILDKQWKLLDAAMERAKAFGTDKLRVFTFMLNKGETPSEKSYARIDELIREAARRAKGYRLAVENIGGGHVWSGAQSGEFLKRVKESNVGHDVGSEQRRRVRREVVSRRLPQARPGTHLPRPPARFQASAGRQSGLDGGGRRRVRQSGPDPRAVEGRLQGDLHAGDPLARSEGQTVLHRDVAAGAVEGDRSGD